MNVRHLSFAVGAALAFGTRPAVAQLKVVTSTTDLYDIARRDGYRFLSFGDCMLLERA